MWGLTIKINGLKGLVMFYFSHLLTPTVLFSSMQKTDTPRNILKLTNINAGFPNSKSCAPYRYVYI